MSHTNKLSLIILVVILIIAAGFITVSFSAVGADEVRDTAMEVESDSLSLQAPARATAPKYTIVPLWENATYASRILVNDKGTILGQVENYDVNNLYVSRYTNGNVTTQDLGSLGQYIVEPIVLTEDDKIIGNYIKNATDVDRVFRYDLTTSKFEDLNDLYKINKPTRVIDANANGDLLIAYNTNESAIWDRSGKEFSITGATNSFHTAINDNRDVIDFSSLYPFGGAPKSIPGSAGVGDLTNRIVVGRNTTWTIIGQATSNRNERPYIGTLTDKGRRLSLKATYLGKARDKGASVDMNISGKVIGTFLDADYYPKSGFLCDNCTKSTRKLYDLTTLVSDSGWKIINGRDINNKHWIVGNGDYRSADRNVYHNYVMIPQL